MQKWTTRSASGLVSEIATAADKGFGWFVRSTMLVCAVLWPLQAPLSGQSGPSACSLQEAAREGDFARVVAMVDQGVDINSKCQSAPHGLDTALAEAGLRSHVDIVRLLVDKGAKADSLRPLYQPLFMNRSSADRLEILSLFIKSGANVNKDWETSSGGQADSGVFRYRWRGDPVPFPTTALIEAAASNRADEVEILISRGADVNARGHAEFINDGFTALHGALLYRDPKIARMLLAHGANPNEPGGSSIPPVLHWVCTNALGIVNSKAPGLGAVAAGQMKMSVAALSESSLEKLQLLVGHGADIEMKRLEGILYRGYTPLMVAAEVGWLEGVRFLLDKGAGGKEQALRCAATENPSTWVKKPTAEQIAFFREASARRIRVAEELLKRGADINAKEPKGRTALELARLFKNNEMAAFLQQAGAK